MKIKKNYLEPFTAELNFGVSDFAKGVPFLFQNHFRANYVLRLFKNRVL